MVDGNTTAGFRVRRTDCTQHSNDVGLFLLDKVYNRTTYDTDESEVQYADRYKHQIDRSTKADATGSKGIGNKYQNISQLYH